MKLLFFRSGSMCFQFGISTFFVALYMLTAAIISADNLFFSGNCPREDLNIYRYIYSVFSTLCKWGSWGWSIVGLTQCKYIQLFIYIQLFYIYTVPGTGTVYFWYFFRWKTKCLLWRKQSTLQRYTCRGSVPCIPVFNGLLDPYSEYGSWSRFWKKH